MGCPYNGILVYFTTCSEHVKIDNEQLQRGNEFVVCNRQYSEVITECFQICHLLTVEGNFMSETREKLGLRLIGLPLVHCKLSTRCS